MKNNDLKVSIIVITYNREKDVSDFLKSLQNVGITKDNSIEIIVVVNGYLDATIKKKYHSVKFVNNGSSNKAEALNKGICISKGRYLVFTDDDVIVKDPLWITNLIKDFYKDSSLGYIAGNVLAYEIWTCAQKIWEEKGGLSKGRQFKTYNEKELGGFKYRFLPWPINRIAAGANCAIPRRVIKKVGCFSTFLGPGAPVLHGESLEIVYRIIREGYKVAYNPSACVFHKHPQESSELRRKLFVYGIGNTAYQLYIFAKFKDVRSLFWGLLGHNVYVLTNLFKCLMGCYPLPFSYTIFSLLGSLAGIPIFGVRYLCRDRIKYD